MEALISTLVVFVILNLLLMATRRMDNKDK